MRRFRTLAVALVVLAVGATVAIAAQAPNPTNAGFTTKTYNHFGDPARGTVVVETWGIVHDVGDPASTPSASPRRSLCRRRSGWRSGSSSWTTPARWSRAPQRPTPTAAT